MAQNKVLGGARGRARALQSGILAVSAAAVLAAPAMGAQALGHRHSHPGRRDGARLMPNSVVISGTVFPRDGVAVSPGQQLPFAANWGNTVPEPAAIDAQAVAGGQYPYVFNNASTDGSFGVDTPIELWDASLRGWPLGTVHVPTSAMTTSFESKSELAINVSTGGQDLSFSGYNAPAGTFDASNSNTPGLVDPTNPDLAGPYFRVAGDLNSDGRMTFTETNSYTGDNGRAVLLDSADDQFFAAGNDNNGAYGSKGAPAVPSWMLGATGAQTFPESFASESAQTAAGGDPAALLGSFSINWLPAYAVATDKPGKDTNFRGLTVYDNVVYYTKGSGGLGVNSVYFVDTTGTACSQADAVGLPVAGAPLPTPGVSYDMCILRGFNQVAAHTDHGDHPFGLWFANPDTLYVADEGNGNFGTLDPSNPYADAQAQPHAGLQKWVFDPSTQSWQLAYVLQDGLALGTPYSVAGYPTGNNDGPGGSGLPWAPATDGLRNISGHVNGDGTVTIYATTSTVSGSGDQGGDPNAVVAITDSLGATAPATATAERFTTFREPAFGVRYGGVAVLPWSFGRRRGW